MVTLKVGEVSFLHSRTTCLIPTWDQMVDLVYVEVFKIKHRQEIVRY